MRLGSHVSQKNEYQPGAASATATAIAAAAALLLLLLLWCNRVNHYLHISTTKVASCRLRDAGGRATSASPICIAVASRKSQNERPTRQHHADGESLKKRHADPQIPCPPPLQSSAGRQPYVLLPCSLSLSHPAHSDPDPPTRKKQTNKQTNKAKTTSHRKIFGLGAARPRTLERVRRTPRRGRTARIPTRGGSPSSSSSSS